MLIAVTILSLFVGICCLLYALGYGMLNGEYTPNDPVPIHIMIVGTIGLTLLSIPFML